MKARENNYLFTTGTFCARANKDLLQCPTHFRSVLALIMHTRGRLTCSSRIL